MSSIGREYGKIGSHQQSSLHVIDDRTGRYYQIPVLHNAIDASEFKRITAASDGEYYADQNEHGICLLDPGFSNTAVSKSKITYVDGFKGIIQYRGYNISDIIENGKKFIDTLHLLRRQNLSTNFLEPCNLPDNVHDVIKAFPPSGSPVGMMIAGLSAVQSNQMHTVPAHAAKNIYLGNQEAVDEQVITVLGSLPVVLAIAYCHHTGRQFTQPKTELSYIENLFLMMGHVEQSTGLPNPEYVSYFEKLWILVADHELTCSTAALLQTASSLPDAISCMVSAISASYSPLHGGAIEVAYKDMAQVGSIENCQVKIDRVKAGKERLFGYGHRLYRVTDPRSVYIQQILDQLRSEIASDPLLKVAFELDRIAEQDEYFISRKLRPNADLFAAFTYGAMGFPPEIILPISIISRTQGLMAHWKEAMSGTARIWRPRQIYLGDLDRKF